MKLLRYGPEGSELPGMLDINGKLRSLHPVVADIVPSLLSPEGLQILAAIDPLKLPLVSGNPRLGVPVAGVRQFVGVGLNYAAHAEEAGAAIPTDPLIFNKAPTSLCGADDDIVMPEGADSVDWEVELGFVIGTDAFQVGEAEALNYVAGYFTANDVSERDFQLLRGGQVVKGKSLPSFGPVGPWLVTKDEIADPQNLNLVLAVNGVKRQQSNTSDMLFSVRQLVAHISSFFRLQAGDMVVTGTPAGVGYGMDPKMYLKPGDTVVAEIEGLGRQTKKVRRARA